MRTTRIPSAGEFLDKLMHQAEIKKVARHHGTARNYMRAWSSFGKYISETGSSDRQVSGRLISGYSRWLDARGCSLNTISFYMRILRAVWNANHIKTDPFEDVYTGVGQTRKRAMSPELVHELCRLSLSDPALELSRDIFIFSIAMRGMSFVDIAFLRWKDLRGDILTYVRRKTGTQLSVKLESVAMDIIMRWKRRNKSYIFPIINAEYGSSKAYHEYEIALRNHNEHLKHLGAMVGFLDLSSYCARHTWATTAQNCNVPLTLISKGMGHSSENTTRIYLGSFDNNLLDKANHKVLKALLL